MRPIVLVVDDEPSLHDALGPVLELEGFGVRSARTIEDALSQIDREPCDMVLADLSLSGAGGSEGLGLIRRLHAERPGLPVVLFTARGTAEVFAAARRLGAADAWSKDLPIPELIRRVRATSRRAPGEPPSP